MKITKQLFFALVIFLALPRMTEAAVLYFSPPGGEERVGDVFTVDAKIDLESGEECINVIEGTIGFDRNFLEVVDFGVGESILSLWLNLPKLTDMPEVNRLARLSFSGGTPGGYCGKIPGDPGASNIVGKIAFKVKKYQPEIAADSNAKIYFLDTSKVLLNDGLGTAAKVTRKDASYFIADAQAEPKQEWENLLTADKTPPEPFILEIQHNPELYEDKYYIVFSTTDKQTGIDRYEVIEKKKLSESGQSWWQRLTVAMFKGKNEEPAWQVTSSPYLLKDQSMSSNIAVKAVDKAGNERIAEYMIVDDKTTVMGGVKYLPLVLLLIVIVSALGLYSYRRVKAKRQVP